MRLIDIGYWFAGGGGEHAAEAAEHAGGGGGGHQTIPSIFTGMYDKFIMPLPETHFLAFLKNGDYGVYWWDSIWICAIVALVLCTLGFMAGRRRERVPFGIQNLFEWAMERFEALTTGMVGPHGRAYTPLIATIFTYIFVINLCGLMPAFRAPTMVLVVPLGISAFTIIMVQVYGIKASGLLGHAKHFTGPNTGLPVFAAIPLAILFLGVELVGETVKPISLALRLRNNIYGEDMVIENLMHLVHAIGPIPMQLPMLLFGLFTSFLQAFIFSALTCIYISLVTAHAAEHHEEH